MKKIKEILAVGCSHIYGAETIPGDANHPDSINYSFAKHLADKYDCRYTNIACSGICNFEIARRLQQHLDFSRKDIDGLFVLIGWTDFNRFSFFPESQVKKDRPNTFCARLLNISSVEVFAHNLVTLMNNPLKKNPWFLQKVKELKNGEQFFNFLQDNIFDSNYYVDLNYLIRVTITNYLIAKKINHLTLPAHYFKKYYNTIKYEEILDNGHNLLQYKHNFHYLDQFKKYGVEPGGHLGRKAHEEIANFLHTKLMQGTGFIKE